MSETVIPREAILEALKQATADDLCAALRECDLCDSELFDKLDINIQGYEDDARIEGREEAENQKIDALDSEALCDAIAEGRTRDALDILYEARLGNGLHPSTQMRLVQPRRRAG